MVQIVVSDLSERKNIIELRFGFSAKKEHIQKEIADFLEFSQSYTSRLEKRIMLRLKRNHEQVR